jgi:hypothetical protein
MVFGIVKTVTLIQKDAHAGWIIEIKRYREGGNKEIRL